MKEKKLNGWLSNAVHKWVERHIRFGISLSMCVWVSAGQKTKFNEQRKKKPSSRASCESIENYLKLSSFQSEYTNQTRKNQFLRLLLVVTYCRMHICIHLNKFYFFLRFIWFCVVGSERAVVFFFCFVSIVPEKMSVSKHRVGVSSLTFRSMLNALLFFFRYVVRYSSDVVCYLASIFLCPFVPFSFLFHVSKRYSPLA